MTATIIHIAIGLSVLGAVPAHVSLLQVVTAFAAAPATQPADVRFGPLPETNTVFTPAQYDYSEWQMRRNWLIEQVRIAAGLVPEPPRVPLDAHVFGKLVRDGYTIEKVYFTSSPGLYVTGNLYRPLNATGKCPVVACPHGHWAHGRLHHDNTGSVPARCITLARSGAVVLAYDMVGYNDSARTFKHGDPRLDTPETALWGIGHLQLQTLNTIRVIDFLLSLPEADPTRVGVTGASGGGTQTFIVSAIDGRVTVAAPVNMISSTMQGGCVCENAPLLRIDTNNMEIAALFAPRPMLMVSASGDWTKLTPTVEFPFIRGIYSLYAAADRVVNKPFDAPHNYNLASREAMYDFFGKRLLGRTNANAIHEGTINVERNEDMLVFNGQDAPADWPTLDQVIERKQAEVRQALAAYEPVSKQKFEDLRAMVRNVIQHAAGTRWPRARDVRKNISMAARSGVYLQFSGLLEREGRLVRVLGFTHPSQAASAYTICVGPAGLDGADRHPDLIAGLIAAGQRVVFVEPFSTGGNRRSTSGTQASERASGFFTTFNRTDASEAAYDIITALLAASNNELSPPGLPPMSAPARIRLVGLGRMGPVCLLARAILPEFVVLENDVRLVADMNGFDAGRDAAYVDQLFVPCIQRIGGLPAIAAAASNGPLWLHNTQSRLDATWIQQATVVTRVDVKVDADSASPGAIATWLANDR